jgi:hypothetical protein
MECSMTADPAESRLVHSWRATELALPGVAVAPRVEPRIARPAALRFPIDSPRPVVTRVGLLDMRPAVQSFHFQSPVTQPPAAPRRMEPTADSAATSLRVLPPEGPET